MTFKIGDRVVHPQHGVGHVVNLADREFEPGVIRQYYEVNMPAGSTLWVPVDSTMMGLRKPAEKSDIARCRKILISRPSALDADVRSRQSNLASRLRQGTITTFCEVVRDLHAYGEHKSLYGTIAGFYRVTKDVLCQEWSVVAGITVAEAAAEVSALLEKGRQTMKTSGA